MKKNIAIVLLSIVCAVFCGIEMARYVSPRLVPPAPPRMEQGDRDTDGTQSSLKQRIARITLELRKKDEELARMRREIGRHDRPDEPVAELPSAVARQLAPADTGEDEMPRPAPLKDVGQGIAGLLQDTNLLQSFVAQAMRANSGMQRLTDGYAAFFAGMGLTDKQIEQAMALVKAELANPLQRAMGDKFGANSAFEQKMRDLLGDEAYERFAEFHATRNARQVVGQFEAFLEQGNRSIDDAQRDRLVALFHQSGQVGNDLNGGLTFSLGTDGEGSVENGIDNSLDELVVRYDALADDAEKVLDPEQSAQLRAFLDRQLERKEMEGDMARQLVPNLRIGGVGGVPVQGSVQVIAEPPVVVTDK